MSLPEVVRCFSLPPSVLVCLVKVYNADKLGDIGREQTLICKGKQSWI